MAEISCHIQGDVKIPLLNTEDVIQIICILEIVSAAFWSLKHGNLQMQCHSAEYEVLNK